MDSLNAAVLTGTTVIVGRWCQGKSLNASIVVGGGIYAIILSGISNSQPQFAGQMAGLVLLTAIFIYIIPIGKKLGFLDANGKPTIKNTPTGNTVNGHYQP